MKSLRDSLLASIMRKFRVVTQENIMSGSRLVLVLLLWRESGVSFLSQSCSVVDANPIDLFRYIQPKGVFT